MYSKVTKHSCKGPRGEAVALLAELAAASEKASCTYDLTLEDFLPSDFWPRVRVTLQAEIGNIEKRIGSTACGT